MLNFVCTVVADVLRVWITLSDAALENEWVWERSGQVLGWSNWDPNPTDNGVAGDLEGCVIILKTNFKWHDIGCHYIHATLFPHSEYHPWD